jgi:3-hydroxyacyl-CoA dehydrogenase / enoyl-CoA hydratase / 3-hydroxybutyryl-CoA epimerase
MGDSIRNELVSETGKVPVARVVLDSAGRSVNTLTRAFFAELDGVIGEIEGQIASGKIGGVVISSAKKGSFVVGADLFELRDMSASELDQYLREGQRIFGRLAALPVNTVAAINGDCLGGGLELALACGTRLANKTAQRIGLPEARLGLVPGWGGTVRLVQLIGAEAAVPLLIAGKALPASEAHKVGMVDGLVDGDLLLGVAAERARQRVPTRPRRVAPHANFLPTQRENQKDNPVPAAGRVIEVVEAGLKDPQAGFDAERAALAEMRQTPAGQNLMRLFFLKQQARKTAFAQVKSSADQAAAVNSVGIVGGGTMGSGIAHGALSAGLPVVLVEADESAAHAARRRVHEMFKRDERAGRLSGQGVAAAMGQLAISTRTEDLGQADLIAEAVAEDVALKQKVFGQLDHVAKPGAVLASNTSSIPISQLAAATKRPQSVVGLHFFNPVPIMELVEIIAAKDAQPSALATAIALAARMGKTPVVTADAPGFLINRILFPYLAEALRVLGEGVSIEQVDAAMRQWGMPMGPLELIDHIGLDVTAGIARALAPHLGQRVLVSQVIDAAVAEGRLGRKSGRGFYRYDGNLEVKARPQVDAAMARQFGAVAGAVRAAGQMNEAQLQWRLILPMASEATRAMNEHVVESGDTVDLATVLGLGLAPWRGGLACWMQTVGAAELARRLSEAAAKSGKRLEAAR